MLSHSLFNKRSPGNQAKAHAIAEHGKPATDKIESAVVNPTNSIAALYWSEAETSLNFQGPARHHKIPVAQGV